VIYRRTGVFCAYEKGELSTGGLGRLTFVNAYFDKTVAMEAACSRLSLAQRMRHIVTMGAVARTGMGACDDVGGEVYGDTRCLFSLV